MSLTPDDLNAIGKLITASEERMTGQITASEERMTGKIDTAIATSEVRMSARMDAHKDELLEAIHDVGVEITETKSIVLQHTGGSRIWKHS